MNYLKLTCLVVTTILFLGCVPQKLYYWGDYSKTLYQSKKNPTDESLLSHQQSLERILEESKNNNLRVPPGVYAELGYIYFRQNKKDLAILNFNMERTLYPESALLMNRLENAVKLADKPKPAEDNAASKVLPDKPDKQEKL